MFEQIKKYLAEHALYRETLRELQSLSNRELQDLSISRSDITRLAREAVWGAQPAATTPAPAATVKPLRNRSAFA